MRNLERSYQHLSGDERFKLFVAALGRDDEVEARALGNSCPSYDYRMKDWEFAVRVKVGAQVMATLAWNLAAPAAVLSTISSAAPFLQKCLETMTIGAIDSAVEAHWRAIDPNGNPNERSRSGAKHPHYEDILAGSAGLVWATADQVRAHQKAQHAIAVAMISEHLAAIDRFCLEFWLVTGREAVAAHKELFEDIQEFLQWDECSSDLDEQRVLAAYEGYVRFWKFETGSA